MDKTQTALQNLLDHYVRLVESGDAGFWDAEKEQVVIDARSALAAHGAPVLWRFTGIAGLKKVLTDAQYQAQTPETKRWYEPMCAKCHEAQPAQAERTLGPTEAQIKAMCAVPTEDGNEPRYWRDVMVEQYRAAMQITS